MFVFVFLLSECVGVFVNLFVVIDFDFFRLCGRRGSWIGIGSGGSRRSLRIRCE